ncbi:polyketide synthase dehydratase domain-containing protein, partial [Streptomyces sp. NPDC005808]|uniref:polyketide synthase dehydratase domain-containing protein n=1 Tax=Streptomyces sp. NPDC005808 TaxID=3364734 RepID=UPI0036A0F7F4
TGEVAGEDILSADYWVDHVRQAVRFLDGMRHLETQGVTTYLELGPGGVLSAMGQSCVTEDAAFVPVLRKDRPEAHALTAALAELHAHGASVDWTAYYEGTGAQRTDLPTYAFQHEHYWPEVLPGLNGDVTGFGLYHAEHPLLGAEVLLADGDGIVLTSRLSLDSHPWLADHAVFGSVLLPGTAFVELALHAGERVGCAALEELTLQAPLIIPERGGMVLQVIVGSADADGRRQITVHSSPANGAEDEAWTLHASGVVAAEALVPGAGLAEWPPRNAESVPVDGMYESMTEIGYGYGPVFQGLRAVWRRGGELFAEVALPEEAAEQAGRFGLHPALLDSALHAIGVGGGLAGLDGPGLPFAWTGVSLFAVGSPVLRARITATDGTVSLDLADGTGAPVGRIGSLVLRPVTAQQLDGAARNESSDSLFRLEWTPVPVGDAQAPQSAPEYDVLSAPATEAGTDVVHGVHTAVVEVLAQVQEWLAAERDASARLVVVTRGAVGEVVDLGAAAVWGL